MLTHSDWHDFTLSVLKCKEVRKIYRDHPYGLKPYHIIWPYHFILHNNVLPRDSQDDKILPKHIKINPKLSSLKHIKPE